jgi:hypothetical protein
MANIASAAEVLATSGGTYLSADDKAQLHNEQKAFYIVGAIPEQEGQYGTQTVFDIIAKGMERSRIGFSVNAQRVEQAKNALAALGAGADMVGPCYLGRWERNGRSGWEITFEQTTPKAIPANPVSSTPTPPSQPATPAMSDFGDDDIPF